MSSEVKQGGPLFAHAWHEISTGTTATSAGRPYTFTAAPRAQVGMRSRIASGRGGAASIVTRTAPIQG